MSEEPENDNNLAGIPEEVSPTTHTESLRTTNAPGPRTRARVLVGICLAVFFLGDVFLYSHHRALQARVESHERRIERLDKAITDLLMANDNAEKIEKIEQQVVGIDGQMDDLTTFLKDEAKAEAEAQNVAEDPKKKQRKR